jgi:hypothetical protein
MSQHRLLSTSGFKDIGLGMEGGSGSLAIGSFLPAPMPSGFLAIGGVIQVGRVGSRVALREYLGRALHLSRRTLPVADF